MEYQAAYLMKTMREQPNFAKKLSDECAEITADIASYVENSNCSCKLRIEKYINKNKDVVNEIFAKFLSENPEFVPEKPIEDISGTVIEIEADPIKYKKLIIHLKENNQTYKGLTVMDAVKNTDDGEKVVWLIFFY